ncbi:MAG: hypothetical protein JJV92_01645 [Desulfosarcina sp.]|nr:hypothetical protein [Desulfobacterales bacterium]
MEYFTIELCEILLGFTALSVCVFIVLFIIISTFKKRHKISVIEQKEQTGNFNESVVAQLIKQQLDKSLVDIVGAINDEKLSNNKDVREKVVQEKLVPEEIAKEPEPVDSDEYDQVEPGNSEMIEKPWVDIVDAIDDEQFSNNKVVQEEIAKEEITKEPELVDSDEYDQVELGNSEMIETPLVDIVDAINDEKLSNNKVIREKVVQEKFVLEEIAKEPEPVDSDGYDQVESGNSEMIDKYDEAADLAKSGMNVCDIADRVKLSMGEIDLIVKLNSLRNESSRAA